MSMKSQAQRGAMAAAAEGNSTLDIPKDVGAKMLADDEGGKLPQKTPKKKPPKDRADRLAGQGLVSDEQLAKAKKKLAPKIAAPVVDDDDEGDHEYR